MNERLSTVQIAGVVITVVLLTISACATGKSGPTSSAGDESVPSPTGIDATQMAQLIPVAVSSMVVEAIPKGIAVKWYGTGQDDIRYQIYRRVSSTESWQKLATMNIVGDNREQYLFTDTTGQPGITYIYGVKAVAFYGKESALSQSHAIIFPFS